MKFLYALIIVGLLAFAGYGQTSEERSSTHSARELHQSTRDRRS
jgi:hypothetical protein